MKPGDEVAAIHDDYGRITYSYGKITGMSTDGVIAATFFPPLTLFFKDCRAVCMGETYILRADVDTVRKEEELYKKRRELIMHLCKLTRRGFGTRPYDGALVDATRIALDEYLRLKEKSE